jgi:hypothetical protein
MRRTASSTHAAMPFSLRWFSGNTVMILVNERSFCSP